MLQRCLRYERATFDLTGILDQAQPPWSSSICPIRSFKALLPITAYRATSSTAPSGAEDAHGSRHDLAEISRRPSGDLTLDRDNLTPSHNDLCSSVSLFRLNVSYSYSDASEFDSDVSKF